MLRFICWFRGHEWGPDVSIWESDGYYDIGRKMLRRVGYRQECEVCGKVKESALAAIGER